MIATNLIDCFLCSQLAARHMRQHTGEQVVKDIGQPSGRIVNIGSGCNNMPFPNLAAYTARKGGIVMSTKVAALELGGLGITVNCVAPGAIEIERTRNEAPDYVRTWAPLTNAAGPRGATARCRPALEFFADEAGDFVTGPRVAGFAGHGPAALEIAKGCALEIPGEAVGTQEGDTLDSIDRQGR